MLRIPVPIVPCIVRRASLCVRGLEQVARMFRRSSSLEQVHRPGLRLPFVSLSHADHARRFPPCLGISMTSTNLDRVLNRSNGLGTHWSTDRGRGSSPPARGDMLAGGRRRGKWRWLIRNGAWPSHFQPSRPRQRTVGVSMSLRFRSTEKTHDNRSAIPLLTSAAGEQLLCYLVQPRHPTDAYMLGGF